MLRLCKEATGGATAGGTFGERAVLAGFLVEVVSQAGDARASEETAIAVGRLGTTVYPNGEVVAEVERPINGAVEDPEVSAGPV